MIVLLKDSEYRTVAGFQSPFIHTAIEGACITIVAIHTAKTSTVGVVVGSTLHHSLR